MIGARERLDAALTRLGLGEPDIEVPALDLDEILERAATPATHLDVETALSHDIPALVGAIRTALFLHPIVRVPNGDAHRELCGLCRDPWPCETVRALRGDI